MVKELNFSSYASKDRAHTAKNRRVLKAADKKSKDNTTLMNVLKKKMKKAEKKDLENVQKKVKKETKALKKSLQTQALLEMKKKQNAISRAMETINNL
jgi:hypothetical protein